MIVGSVVVHGLLLALSYKFEEGATQLVESQKQVALLEQDTIKQREMPASIEDTAPTQQKEIEEIGPVSDLRTVSYQVSRGDTLTAIWRKNGGDSTGGIAAARAFKKAGVRLASLKAGEEVELTVSDERGIVGFRKVVSAERELILEKSEDGKYTHSFNEIPIEIETRKVYATIETSIADAASKANVPYEVVDDIVDLFGGRVAFRRDLHPGDTFSVVYDEKRTVSGELIGIGSVKTASIHTGGELLAAIQYIDAKGEKRYFDEGGDLLGSYFLRYPLRFTRISSVFNKSRFHPVLKRRVPHNGVDFAAPTGTPVRSVADGVVVTAGYNGAAGRMVKIRHDGRYSTAYLHLSRISGGIRKGTRVKRGQTIGAVGMTGRATGPHLHFSLYDRGRYVDPMKVKLPRIQLGKKQAIPKKLLEAKLEEINSYHTELQMAAVEQRRERVL